MKVLKAKRTMEDERMFILSLARKIIIIIMVKDEYEDVEKDENE